MSYIKDFLIKYNYDPDAVTFLEKAYQTLSSNKVAFQTFLSCIDLYKEKTDFNHNRAFETVYTLSDETGIHKYTLELLYMICLTPHLKELYDLEGIADNIYDDTVCDLKWKAKECKDNYGVWGTFVGWWTIDFFKLKRFAIGRLQYNLKELSHDICANGIQLTKGQKYISVHIPSSGPLLYDECQSSYKAAADFFKKRYRLDNIIFGCESWLLSPDNEKILPATSNILKFMHDYTILESKDNPTNSDLWRIFNVMQMPEDASELPEDTSLRRAFKKWISEGNTINLGFGFIFYSKFYLGVDGGGTSSVFVLENEDGTYQKRLTSGPCNIVNLESAQVKSALEEGINNICSGIPRCQISAFFGLAGAGTKKREEFLNFFDSFGFSSVSVGSDAKNVISAGLKGNNGIIVILGTGSVVYSSINDTIEKFGGYGHLFGDYGSGYEIARAAISAVLSADDGSGRSTMLSELFFNRFNKTPFEQLSAFYQNGKSLIASFAPDVFYAYEKEDAVAKKIISDSYDKLSEQIKSAINLFDIKDTVDIVISGGLTAVSNIILPILKEKLGSFNVNITALNEPPVVGAIRLAKLQGECKYD